MKNKIIFKTLMLKGEAGSTIVSMEKTGHVGTADIYTITFNDGSTTEISLENMSAITSVEKTSSTDTEDIYTITCADGSTQTFSVLNHNADIAAMSDDIDTIDARVDNFVNSVVPNTVETLWTGSIQEVGDSATLSKAVSNFDYIDLYLLGSADSKYIRVPATQTAVQIQQQNLSDDASSNFLRLWEMGVSISGSTVSITKSIAWAWDDPDNSNPTVTANAQNAIPITRINGVKVASDTPAEVTDIRVGADGTTYNSAGAAVRGQISDLNEDLNHAVIDGYMYIDVSLTSDDFKQGFYDADSRFSTSESSLHPKRIAIKNAVIVKSGHRIRYDVTGFDVSFKVFGNPVGTSQTALQATDWLPNTGIFNVLYDGYLTINIRKNNVDDITPIEYNSDIYVPALADLVYSKSIAFVNDISGHIATSDILDEAIKPHFVLHKAHSGSGAYVDLNTRNAIIRPIKLPFPIKVSISGSHEFCYQFYSSSENSMATLQEASNWISECVIPANQWFCVAVRNSDNSTTDETTTESLLFVCNSTTFFVPEIEGGRIDANGKVYNTIGDHIRALETVDLTNYAIGSDFIKKPINATLLGSLTYLQAFCIYDGKYYSINGTKIAEQDVSFNVLRDTELNTGHGNSLQLGSGGVAYASGWNDNTIYIVDLATLTATDTITLPVTGYTTCAVDDVNGLVYIFQRSTYPDTAEHYNFVVYDYVNEQIISTKKTTRSFGAMQSCDFIDGKIFVLYGLGTATVPNGYVIFNTSGDIISEYVIGTYANVEPEGVFVDRDTFDVYISYVNKNLYKVI